MSKRYVVCIPDSYVDMVEQFMAAQAHKGLSFAVLCSMAAKAYGMNDIIAPAIAGASLFGQVKDAEHLAVEAAPKRRRGRPKKSEQILPEVSEGNASKRDASKNTPEVVSDREVKEIEPEVSVQTPSPKPAAYIEKENTFTDTSVFSDAPKEHRTLTEKSAHGWADDAFDGLDPDFNPDGGLDDVFDLLSGNK